MDTARYIAAACVGILTTLIIGLICYVAANPLTTKLRVVEVGSCTPGGFISLSMCRVKLENGKYINIKSTVMVGEIVEVPNARIR